MSPMLNAAPSASRSFSPSVAVSARRLAIVSSIGRSQNVLLRGNAHCRVRLKQLVDRIGRRRTDAYDGIEPTADRCCLRHRERSRGGRRNRLREHVMAARTQGGRNERVEGGDAALP